MARVARRISDRKSARPAALDAGYSTNDWIEYLTVAEQRGLKGVLAAWLLGTMTLEEMERARGALRMLAGLRRVQWLGAAMRGAA